MIDLNDEKFDSNDVSIFNNGETGLCEVTLAVEKKKDTDKENAPDYKVVFTSNNGASTNMAFFNVTKDVTYGNGKSSTIDELGRKQGKILKHLIHAVVGSEATLPSAETYPALLGACMKMLHQALSANKGLKVRVLATYGTKNKPSKYVQVRSWVPFVESLAVPVEETKLTVSKDIDQMVKISADGDTGGDEWSTGSTSGSAAAPSLANDDWT